VIAAPHPKPNDRVGEQMEDAMTYYAGLDVSLHETAICVADAEGRIVAEGSVPSDLESFRDVGLGISEIMHEAARFGRRGRGRWRE